MVKNYTGGDNISIFGSGLTPEDRGLTQIKDLTAFRRDC